MTYERKIVVGLDDIRAISLECNECQYRVTMSPDEFFRIPDMCSNGHAWTRGEEKNSSASPVMKFTASLREVRELLGHKHFGFKVLLEIDEPSAS